MSGIIFFYFQLQCHQEQVAKAVNSQHEKIRAYHKFDFHFNLLYFQQDIGVNCIFPNFQTYVEFDIN